MTSLTKQAWEPHGVKPRDAERSKNLFALGLVSWMYTRPVEPTIAWIRERFAKLPEVAAANEAAFKAGHAFGETAEIFAEHYTIEAAELPPGLYRAMTGNRALAWGLLAAAERSKVAIVYGAYPITPASSILEELAQHKRFRIRTIQAEDEIAAVTAAIGAAFGGAVGVTASSGPGIALKGEAIGLAVTAELPLVIFDIQRGGPSTGLPTKTEQADLMQALYGRNSESPIVVLAPATPGDCFYIAYEAVRIAAKYMVPVIVLSDGFLANGSEPWLIPDPKTLPDIDVNFRTDPEGFFPYLREPATLSRPWVRPGTPGLEHRIGGLEKEADYPGPDGRFLTVAVPGSPVKIILWSHAPAAGHPVEPGTAPGPLILESEDLRKDFEVFRQRGVTFAEPEPVDYPFGVRIEAVDPDGNRISLRQMSAVGAAALHVGNVLPTSAGLGNASADGGRGGAPESQEGKFVESRIGIALSGGGARAMAFHLGCLRALHDLGILDRVRVFSTVSGGSVIGALYAANDEPFPACGNNCKDVARSWS